MATIALPRLRLPTASFKLAALTSPRAGLAAATVLFVSMVVAMVAILGPILGGRADPRSLEAALAKAPPGWRTALKPARAPTHLYADVVRLSERPLEGRTAPTAARVTGPVYAILAGDSLPAAPIIGFFTSGPNGPLPIIAQDGRTPAQAYARPFRANGRPKLALVIGGLGLDAAATHRAIETLPPQVTLAFVVYADGLQSWIDMARARGHEVLLETPMEPLDYPDNDPGPYALMAESPAPETIKRLEWVLSRATGYFGLANYQGARFLANDAAYGAFASSVRARGLAFIDDGTAIRRGGGVPRASAERTIDEQLAGPAIDQQFAALEAGALQHGQALGSGFAYPVTLERVSRWSAEVEQRGFQLAPASALLVQK